MLIENALWLYGALLKLQQVCIVRYIDASDIYTSPFGDQSIEIDVQFYCDDKIYSLHVCENGFKYEFDKKLMSKKQIIRFLGRKARRVV